MNIQDIMSKPTATCRPNDTLETAARLMWDHDCGAIPVVDADQRIVGIITDRDICMASYTQGSALHLLPVSDTMAKQVYSCHAEDPLDVAEGLMSDKQIRRLPVVDDDRRPVGMLSINDIARYAASSSRKKKGLDRELTKTLAAICEPREPAIQESAIA